MEELSRVVKFVDEFGQSSNVFLSLDDETTLEYKLFKLLENGKVNSDTEAALALYGNPTLSTSYRMFKSRFRKKLYNHLHFIKLNENRSSRLCNAEHECLSLILRAYSLKIISENKSAIKLLEKALKISDECDFLSLKVRVLEELCMNNLNIYEHDKYLFFENILIEAYQVEQQIKEANLIYFNIKAMLRRETSFKAKTLQSIPDKLNRLEELWNSSNSSRVYSYFYKLKISYLEQLGKYSEIVDVIEEAERLYNLKRINEYWFEKDYNGYILVYSLLQSHQYEKGLDLADKNLCFMNERSVNWFAYMENYVLLALHSQNYSLSTELVSQVFSKANFAKLPDLSKERWELYRQYNFLMLFTPRKEYTFTPPTKENVFVLLPKDKSGFNLSLLVLDVLEGLGQGRLDDLEGQADRVRKYTAKYLKGERAVRPRLFMRLLQQALKGQDPATVREQGQGLLRQLAATPLPGDAFAEVEIVPYEHLWELTLELLEHRQKAK